MNVKSIDPKKIYYPQALLDGMARVCNQVFRETYALLLKNGPGAKPVVLSEDEEIFKTFSPHQWEQICIYVEKELQSLDFPIAFVRTDNDTQGIFGVSKEPRCFEIQWTSRD